MPEDKDKTQDTPGTPDAPQEDELTALKAQLKEKDDRIAELEQIAMTVSEAQELLGHKDGRISELEADLAEVKPTAERFDELNNAYEILKSDFESSQNDRAALNAAATQATQKYLEAVRVLNPGIPANLVSGGTIEEIDDSVEKGKQITDHVRAALVAESNNVRVPAGAPTRAVNLEGMTADELIRMGISQQGGTEQ